MVQIGNFKIGEGNPVFVIAEIGINHNGSLDIAKRLIDAAVEAGCQAVKFQKRTVDVVYTPEELGKPRENPFGPTNGDLKRGLEFGRGEYDEIDRYCKEKNILWFASPWDEESVDFLEQYNPPCYKIASASLTDDGLLQRIRSKGRPIVISTGMSTMDEIKHAVEILGTGNLVLMHTVSTYPAENSELNLSCIDTLKEHFPGVSIGYSGHERGVVLSVCAVAHGVCIVERHITLDRTMWGSDQPASVEPPGLTHLVRDIRMYEDARGDGVKRVLDTEIPIKKKLRRK